MHRISIENIAFGVFSDVRSFFYCLLKNNFFVYSFSIENMLYYNHSQGNTRSPQTKKKGRKYYEH